jgi:hypothetical protein
MRQFKAKIAVYIYRLQWKSSFWQKLYSVKSALNKFRFLLNVPQFKSSRSIAIDITQPFWVRPHVIDIVNV